MLKLKKYGSVALLLVVILVASLVTYSFFPPFVKESFGLYESYEYSQMYLKNDTYSDLVIEYDFVSGLIPSLEAREHLESQVENYTDKEEIKSVLDENIPSKISEGRTSTLQPPIIEGPSYDRDDLAHLEEEYRTHEREDETIGLHVLYLDGVWEENPDVLGLAKQPSTIVIFQETILDFAERVEVGPEDIETSVLTHEFGHILSLVGMGYESDHEDPENQHHCDESAGDCVMAAAVEYKERRGSPEVEEREAPPDDFCVLCQQDLENIREMDNTFSMGHIVTYGFIGGQMIVGLGVGLVIINSSDERKPPVNTTAGNFSSHQKSGWEERGSDYPGYSNGSDVEEKGTREPGWP